MTCETPDNNIIDAIEQLACLLDEQGVVKYANQFWLDHFSQTKSEIISTPFSSLVSSNDAERVQPLVINLTKDQSFSNRFKCGYPHGEGEEAILVCVVKRLDDNTLLLSAEDVTRLHALKNEVLQKQSLLTQTEHMTSVGHWRVDLIKQTVYWSDQVYRIHGVKKSEYQPDLESAINFYHPDDKEKVRAYVQQSMEDGSVWEFRLRIVRPTGEIRHVVSKADISRNDAGEPISIFGVFRDVTDIEKLFEERDLLSQVANTTTTGVVITDPERNVVWTNEAFTHLTGYSLSHVKGQSLGPFLQGEDTDKETIGVLQGRSQKPPTCKCGNPQLSP